MANPDISVKITADASGFARGAAVVSGSLATLQKQMTGLQAVAAKSLAFTGFGSISIAATAAAAGLLATANAAADYGDQLDAMSQRTGVAVEDLAKLQYAAKLSDTSNEALGKGLTVLSSLMIAAAGGAASSAALFEKYGIALRNSDGQVRSATDVLGDLAEVFATMPEGAQKTALAVEFFGKKVGPELIPLLNNGRAGLKALGDEAERLGLIMSKEQTKAAADYNDNLDRMAALSKSAAVAIGSSLIPAINTLLTKLLTARENGLSIGQILFDVLPGRTASLDKINIDKQVAEVIAALAKLKAARDAALKSNLSDGGAIDTSGMEAEIAAQEKLLAYYTAMRKKESGEQEADASKRLALAGQLVSKMKQLEQLRAIDSGKASADILKSDKELNAARLKDAEKLRDALRGAYDASVKESKSAAEEAIKLLDKARSKRASGADKALEASLKDASDEEKATAYGDQAQSLFDQGRYFAAAAGAAKLDGRLQDMEGYAKQADEFLARAESLSGKSGNGELAQGIIEAQAQILEAQAAAKQQEAKALEERAASQMATLNEIEAKINQMVTTAAKFEITADLTQLEADVARIRAEIAKGAVMPITAAPAAVAADVNSPDLAGFASGGFTGWRGRRDVAGVVHGMEYVTPANVTLQPGVIPFLEALRRHGNKVIPGYEAGGLVTALPSGSSSWLTSGSGHNLTLNLGGERYQVGADNGTIDRLTAYVSREALRKGGRR